MTVMSHHHLHPTLKHRSTVRTACLFLLEFVYIRYLFRLRPYGASSSSFAKALIANCMLCLFWFFNLSRSWLYVSKMKRHFSLLNRVIGRGVLLAVYGLAGYHFLKAGFDGGA